MLRVSSSSVKAKGSEGTILGEMLNDMGCINVADSDKSLLENLSIESIINKNPYHIFVVLMGNDTDKAIENAKKLLKENKGYENLDAVKNGRVHLMDKKLFNLKPNGNWDKSYEILKEKLMCE
jgi:iron complex transport system substrate-binding protein